jgi:hypothetical protein
MASASVSRPGGSGSFLLRPWSTGFGAVALVVVNVLMFVYARALGVFPQISMWGASFYSHLGLPTRSPFPAYPVKPILLDMHSMIDVGIIAGALLAAMLTAEWKLRREDWRGALVGLAGGLLMGFGTVLMPPCNMGGFWVATMALSLSGPMSAIGLLLGAAIGGRLLRYEMRSAVARVDFSSLAYGEPAAVRPPLWQRWTGLVMLAVIIVAALLYWRAGMDKVAGLFLFGVVFGIIVQRSRFCFVAAFRDLTVSGDGRVMKWTLLSIALGVIPFALLKAHGYQPMHMVFPMGWHNIFGGLVFGVGMTIAGGCGMGILARSGEGYIRSWLAIAGGLLSAGLWTHIYGGTVGEGWLYGKPVFLPKVMGWYGSVAFVFAFLAIFYIVIRVVEKKRNETATGSEDRQQLVSGGSQGLDVSVSEVRD